MNITEIYIEKGSILQEVRDIPLYLGVDVGIRNLGLCFLFRDRDKNVQLLALYHIDLMQESNYNDFTFLARLNTTLHFIHLPQKIERSSRFIVSIETQQKQTEECKMAQVAGMIKGIIFACGGQWCYKMYFHNSSPSAATSIFVQEHCLFPEQVKGVKKREEKKEKAIEILEAWLLKNGYDGAIEVLRTQLARFVNGRSIKKDERRDHPADAFGHALDALLKEI